MNVKKIKNGILRLIRFALGTLDAPDNRNAPIDAPAAPTPTPVDPWVELKEQLPAKLAWAASIDVEKLAEQASSTPQAVEAVAGFPGSWLKLGKFLEGTERVSLRELLKFESTLEGEAEHWFTTYARSPLGYGPVTLQEFIELDEGLHKPFDRLFDLERFVAQAIESVTELRDYYRLARRLGGRYNQISDNLYRVLNPKKIEILRVKHAACRKTEDYVEFYSTIPDCPPDNPTFLCACKKRDEIAWFLKEDFEARLELAQTSSESEAVMVPQGIQWSRVNFTKKMKELRDAKVGRLRNEEEKARIQAALAGQL